MTYQYICHNPKCLRHDDTQQRELLPTAVARTRRRSADPLLELRVVGRILRRSASGLSEPGNERGSLSSATAENTRRIFAQVPTTAAVTSPLIALPTRRWRCHPHQTSFKTPSSR
jgi:hypothetical protein